MRIYYASNGFFIIGYCKIIAYRSYDDRIFFAWSGSIFHNVRYLLGYWWWLVLVEMRFCFWLISWLLLISKAPMLRLVDAVELESCWSPCWQRLPKLIVYTMDYHGLYFARQSFANFCCFVYKFQFIIGNHYSPINFRWQ